MTEIDLLREIIARDVGDAERRIMAVCEELRAAIGVVIERIAIIEAAHVPAIEEVAAETETETETETEGESDAIADGAPIPLTDELAEEPPAVLEEIAAIEEEIEEVADDVRPERPHFLQRRVFSRSA